VILGIATLHPTVPFRSNLPDTSRMSGLEVFAELRRIRRDIKVIITTAYSQETTVPTIGGKQSWASIRKPYQLNDLWNLIWLTCRGVTPAVLVCLLAVRRKTGPEHKSRHGPTRWTFLEPSEAKK
jgi:CheY-like chemotaxis protein